MKHLEIHQILTDVQHGFRTKRSTVAQLIIIQDIAKAMQEDIKSVYAAIMDFRKAFIRSHSSASLGNLNTMAFMVTCLSGLSHS